MKNSIDVHVEFSFKGEIYTPHTTIDLDELSRSHGLFPPIHEILARKSGIDTYSYLYEVMQEADLCFDNARGLAADFLVDSTFDMEAFVSYKQENQFLDQLQAIATQELGIDDLAQHPALRSALIQAYHLGKGK